MQTGDPVIPQLLHNQSTIMTLASLRNGVCDDPIDNSFAPMNGSNLRIPNKSFPFNSLMVFWPSASQLRSSRQPPTAVDALLPSPAPQRTAAQCVDSLTTSQALLHQAVQYPYLWALGTGELPDACWALRDFSRQYYAYSAHFPRYLTAVISKLKNPTHRLALMENLAEESGQYEARRTG